MILNYVYCCNSVLASVSYTTVYRMASKGKSDHPFFGIVYHLECVSHLFPDLSLMEKKSQQSKYDQYSCVTKVISGMRWLSCSMHSFGFAATQFAGGGQLCDGWALGNHAEACCVMFSKMHTKFIAFFLFLNNDLQGICVCDGLSQIIGTTKRGREKTIPYIWQYDLVLVDWQIKKGL